MIKFNIEKHNVKDLKKYSLVGANLKGADLEGAELQDANLEGADLEDANLEGADLEDVKWNKDTKIGDQSLLDSSHYQG